VEQASSLFPPGGTHQMMILPFLSPPEDITILFLDGLGRRLAAGD
jgi:hypothetical protein